jgi:hypothetical protein
MRNCAGQFAIERRFRRGLTFEGLFRCSCSLPRWTAAPSRSASKTIKRDKGIWQRRCWQHAIRDDADPERHADYIHFNPVKHGYVTRVSDWPHSSFHRYVDSGLLPADWVATSGRLRNLLASESQLACRIVDANGRAKCAPVDRLGEPRRRFYTIGCWLRRWARRKSAFARPTATAAPCKAATGNSPSTESRTDQRTCRTAWPKKSARSAWSRRRLPQEHEICARLPRDPRFATTPKSPAAC